MCTECQRLCCPAVWILTAVPASLSASDVQSVCLSLFLYPQKTRPTRIPLLSAMDAQAPLSLVVDAAPPLLQRAAGVGVMAVRPPTADRSRGSAAAIAAVSHHRPVMARQPGPRSPRSPQNTPPDSPLPARRNVAVPQPVRMSPRGSHFWQTPSEEARAAAPATAFASTPSAAWSPAGRTAAASPAFEFEEPLEDADDAMLSSFAQLQLHRLRTLMWRSSSPSSPPSLPSSTSTSVSGGSPRLELLTQ